MAFSPEVLVEERRSRMMETKKSIPLTMLENSSLDPMPQCTQNEQDIPPPRRFDEYTLLNVHMLKFWCKSRNNYPKQGECKQGWRSVTRISIASTTMIIVMIRKNAFNSKTKLRNSSTTIDWIGFSKTGWSGMRLEKSHHVYQNHHQGWRSQPTAPPLKISIPSLVGWLEKSTE